MTVLELFLNKYGFNMRILACEAEVHLLSDETSSAERVARMGL